MVYLLIYLGLAVQYKNNYRSPFISWVFETSIRRQNMDEYNKSIRIV